MATELPIGHRTITSKKYADGTVGIVDMSNNMWAVVAIDNHNGMILYSRSFCYTDSTEKSVWEACRKFYKIVKECIYQKKYDALEDFR